MWVEIFSTLCTAVSAMLVGIGFYKKDHIGKARLAVFILAVAAGNCVLTITLPHYLSVGAFVLAATLLCKIILKINYFAAFASALPNC